MSTIRQNSRISSNKQRWVITGLLTAVLFACGFGYAAGAWQLFAPDGTVALEYRAFSPGDGPIEGVDTDALRKLLNPGEAALFNLKNADQQIGLVNELQYTDYDVFQVKTGSYPPAREIGSSSSFAFYTGSLAHNLNVIGPVGNEDEGNNVLDTHELKEPKELLEVAGVTSYQLVPLGDVTGYHASYRDDSGSEVTLQASYGESWRTVFTQMNEQVMEKIALHANEALYITAANGAWHKVVWTESSGGQFVYLELNAKAGDVSRASLIEVAEQIAGHEG